jgi:MoaA/NifB/PqqE/SkfB family radical SAM enzyme
MSLAEVQRLASELPALGARLVVFSGGEPLLRTDVMEVADAFLRFGLKLHLLTSGLALEKHAEGVARRFEEVTVSLDGHTAEGYESIRGVRGLAPLERGIARLRSLAPSVRIRARSTLHRLNFRELPHLIDKARGLGLDQVSFLSADVTTGSFGRSEPGGSASSLLLSAEEADAFEALVESVLVSHAADFERGFVAERGDKLRRLPRYYQAHLGRGPFSPVRCNAPWASVVIESTGQVRPCFFLPPVGQWGQRTLASILGTEMVDVRRNLDTQDNETCRRCVCSLSIGLRSQIG